MKSGSQAVARKLQKFLNVKTKSDIFSIKVIIIRPKHRYTVMYNLGKPTGPIKTLHLSFKINFNTVCIMWYGDLIICKFKKDLPIVRKGIRSIIISSVHV